jgi:hypothetical protein
LQEGSILVVLRYSLMQRILRDSLNLQKNIITVRLK